MGDPFSHQELGELYEMGEILPLNRGRALFHHALAAKLFLEKDDDINADLEAARRGSLARHFPYLQAANILKEVLDWQAK